MTLTAESAVLKSSNALLRSSRARSLGQTDEIPAALSDRCASLSMSG